MTFCSRESFTCSVENAPTCHRAPRWPDPEFSPKNAEKIPPGPKFWTPGIYPQNTPKIPKNTPKIPKMPVWGIFSVFSGYLNFLGFQNLGPGGIFSAFFVEVPGRAISGSVAGRGVLNCSVTVCSVFSCARYILRAGRPSRRKSRNRQTRRGRIRQPQTWERTKTHKEKTLRIVCNGAGPI